MIDKQVAAQLQETLKSATETYKVLDKNIQDYLNNSELSKEEKEKLVKLYAEAELPDKVKEAKEQLEKIKNAL